MKNLFLLFTNKSSSLYREDDGTFEYDLVLKSYGGVDHYNIHITNDEDIKDGDWYYLPRTNSVHKCIENPTELNLERIFGVAKIILTTDTDLIKDGVQEIPDEFLEWFVNNPSCEEIEIFSQNVYSIGKWDIRHSIIIPKEEPKSNLERLPFPELVKEFAEYYKNIPLIEESKQETLEKTADNFEEPNFKAGVIYGFIEGAKWQAEKMYSEEEIHNILSNYKAFIGSGMKIPYIEWFEQFKKQTK